MHRIFVPLYRYFEKHKGQMWALLVVSSVLFVFFGLKVQYEEDIAKLVPAAASDNSELAFGSLKVKDMIFVQIAATDSSTTQYDLAAVSEEFADKLFAIDSVNHHVADVLYRIPDDLAVNGLYFALGHVPSFVDTSCYRAFEKLVEPEAIEAQMAVNRDLVMEDETGSATEMVSTDPLNLRSVMFSSLMGTDDASEVDDLQEPDTQASPLGNISGFSLVDGCLFSADGTVALVFISPDFASLDSKAGAVLVREIEKTIESVEADHPEVRVLFHGAPVRSVYNARRIKADLLETIGFSLIVILLVLVLCFKSFDIIPLNIIPVVYGTFFALTFIWLIKGMMSLVALGIGAIVLGVALSYCLHVIVHFKFTGDPEKMLRDESTPVCLGCITTIGAFLGLLFTESDLLRDFGIFSSLALAGNTLFALIFLPHFLKKTKKNEAAFKVIDKINTYPYDRKPLIISFVCIIIAVGLIFSHKVTFDTDLRNIGYQPSNLVESENMYAEKNFGGNIQRFYAVASPDLDEALDLNVAVMERFDSLKSAGVISKYSAVVPALFQSAGQQQLRIEAWENFWTPELISMVRGRIRSAAADNDLREDMFEPFFTMVGSNYEPANLYEEGIIPDALLSNFIEKSGAEGQGERYLVFTSAQMKPQDKDRVDSEIAKAEHAIVIDPFFYTNNMVRIIHDDFNLTLMISSIFVLLVLLISYRNLWVAIVSFLPMFLSWYVVQGLMAIFGLQFNLINIVISTFIFGIGVDYSIFVMDGLLSQARGGDGNILQWHKSAIFFSAFVLVVVVCSLLFARHPALSSIGVSTIIGMLSTILITYTLQPLLFRMMLKISWIRKSIVR